jgi:hypothetical protein
MHNTFSFSRLWLLIKKQWFDNRKLYTLSAGALAGILAIIFTLWISFNGNHTYHEDQTHIIFLVMLFIGGLIFASIIFSPLADKSRGIYWLSVPATAMEKLVCGIFYGILVFIAAYLLCFFAIQKIALTLISVNPKNTLKAAEHSIFAYKASPYIFYVFLALQSLFILGSAYFEKFAFIKTIIIMVVVIFTFSLFVQFVMLKILPPHIGMNDLTTFRIYDDNAVRIYRIPQWAGNTLSFLAKFIWAPVLLTATYFRLKEKEI